MDNRYIFIAIEEQKPQKDCYKRYVFCMDKHYIFIAIEERKPQKIIAINDMFFVWTSVIFSLLSKSKNHKNNCYKRYVFCMDEHYIIIVIEE